MLLATFTMSMLAPFSTYEPLMFAPTTLRSKLVTPVLVVPETLTS